MPTQPARFDLTSFLVYNGLVLPSVVAAFQLGRFVSEKARAGLEGRDGVWGRLATARERLRGGIWLHVSSAGEFEQALPLIRSLKAEAEERGVELPVLSTVFSPSGYGFAQGRPEPDHVDFLPLDTAPAASRAMEWLQPRALVFVKYDCWPNLVWSARRRNIPVLLLGATLRRGSLRARQPARWFFRRLLDCFTAVGAVSDVDAHRFRHRLGVRVPVTVTGDTRADQVLHRRQSAESNALVRALRGQPFRYLVLGSVWPQDEAVVLGPSLEALSAEEDLGLLVVPHEPTVEHLAALEATIASHRLQSTRLSELVELRTLARRSTAASKDPRRWRVILVDCVGILADLYAASIAAYVGGGFGTGVHSVLEPAVWGVPVLFGPRHHNAFEAGRLLDAGAALRVGTEEDMAHHLRQLLAHEDQRQKTGDRGHAYVAQQRGASERSLQLLRPHVFETPDP